jgi:RHS repeat-associated protein
LSCDTTQNNFNPTTSYILGPGNEQLAELAWSGGVPTPAHTNVWAGGQLAATYSNADPINFTAGILYFHLTDWLGTLRVLTDQSGNLAQTCDSLPFGDGESCPTTPTEYLFTGKERDTESGNDYFGARYYASTMGRFLSPDWSAKEDPVPYANLDDPQSLNLYAYVRNNPLSRSDPDGHELLSANLLPHLDVSQFTSVHEKLSDEGADFIGRGFENPKNKGFNKKDGLYYQYDDGYGKMTIGYGHKVGPKENFSNGLTHDQVVDLFKKDAQAQINAVKKWVPFRISQQEVDALASLHFNTGPNASTIPERHLMSGRDVTQGDFTIYNHVDGEVSRGLTIRRVREFQIFDEGVYNAAH